jgi:hypothetical protein
MTPEELNTLKSQGFIVSTNEDQDFFDSLKFKFLISNPLSGKADKKALKVLEDFIQFSKKQLVDNPPTTMTFLDSGLALQFADYTRVVLVDTKTLRDAPASSVSISDSDRKGGPIVYRQVDTSVPITR